MSQYHDLFHDLGFFFKLMFLHESVIFSKLPAEHDHRLMDSQFYSSLFTRRREFLTSLGYFEGAEVVGGKFCLYSRLPLGGSAGKNENK